MIALSVVIAFLGAAAAFHVARPLARGASGRGRYAPPAAAAGIALVALAAYAVNASPSLPGASYADRVERLAAADPAELTLAEQEERLRMAARENPGDAQALALLGRLLARTDRELEAVGVLERALRIREEPRILSDLGQALVNLNEGEVTEQARRAFAAAHESDPGLPEPAFFLGVAAYQAGDRGEAARLWAGILARLPADDPFRAAIAARAADLLSRPAGGPGEEDAPFAAMAQAGADREEMVAAMVDRLAARLEETPDDFAGWLVLARARAMLGETGAAGAALERARGLYPDDTGRSAMIAALAGALQLEESDA